MTHRVKLIFNPHADRGRSWNMASALTPIIEQRGGASWSATEYPEHATELAEQAGREGFKVVAAVGGDGTVHEVVNGLMRLPVGQRPALAAVPIGSGNDFCNNVGVNPLAEAAMERVFEGEPRRIDLGLITDQDGRTEYWDNTLGIGFDATVTLYSYSITRLQGFSMYLWAVIQTILRNHDAPPMKITTDSEQIDERVLMFVACNGPREGGGFHVAPDAVPDDGLLHYAMIGHVSRAKMFRLIPEVMNGTHGRFKDVRLGSFRELELTSEQPVTVHVDGEIFAGFTSEVTGLKIKILPQALDVII
ncbi:MAG: diacylglycerol kinase family lipid kinase [Anaerolineales bacterium]|jgi:diacylglycerol kinase (ATP)